MCITTENGEIINLNHYEGIRNSKESIFMDNQYILDRFEKRSLKLKFEQNKPSITVIVYPVSYPKAPLIPVTDIYELYKSKSSIRRVMGGVCYSPCNIADTHSYSELSELSEINEYGIAYRKNKLPIYNDNVIYLFNFVDNIRKLIEDASKLYETCENTEIEVSVLLKEVCGITLQESDRNLHLNYKSSILCLDSNIAASRKCCSEVLSDEGKCNNLIESLTLELMWAFNFPTQLEILKTRLRDNFGLTA